MPNEYIPSPPLSLLHDMILLFPPVYELVPSPPLPLLFVILYYVLLQSAILWPTSPSEASTSEGHGSLPPHPLCVVRLHFFIFVVLHFFLHFLIQTCMMAIREKGGQYSSQYLEVKQAGGKLQPRRSISADALLCIE